MIVPASAPTATHRRINVPYGNKGRHPGAALLRRHPEVGVVRRYGAATYATAIHDAAPKGGVGR